MKNNNHALGYHFTQEQKNNASIVLLNNKRDLNYHQKQEHKNNISKGMIKFWNENN